MKILSKTVLLTLQVRGINFLISKSALVDKKKKSLNNKHVRYLLDMVMFVSDLSCMGAFQRSVTHRLLTLFSGGQSMNNRKHSDVV